MAWYAEYDKTLEQLQKQLAAQLEQEKAQYAASEGLSEFMREKQGELLTEQGEARQGAATKFGEVLQPAFQNTLQQVQSLSAGIARDTEVGLQQDPGYRTAMDTINAAGSGEGISGAIESGREASTVRGSGGHGMEAVERELALNVQRQAAPLAIQKQIEGTLRPFQTQAAQAGIAKTLAQTEQMGVGAQAQSLSSLLRTEANPIEALSGLYGQHAGSFAQPAGSTSAIKAGYADYGYEPPFGLGDLM